MSTPAQTGADVLDDLGGQVWCLAASAGSAFAYGGSGGAVVRSAPGRARTVERPSIVFSLAWSPDARLLALGTLGGGLELLDADGGPAARTAGHGADTVGLDWHPDGALLASASYDGTVGLWDRDGARRGTLRGHEGKVRAVAWSPDGAVLASASYDGTVRLWERDGAPVTTLRGHDDGVRALDWHPDGTLLASASNDATVRLWDTATGEATTTLRGARGQLYAVAFATRPGDPSTTLPASGGADGDVHVWGPDGEPLAPLSGHRGTVTALRGLPGGRLVSGAQDGTVRTWEVPHAH